ncbi:MAG: hypothetical protein K1Y02_06850 [Candidatus Hydrogenedentes bacterium]|nr:hypothetical protein [Candidatus Hydrogenedentota bacterium]
MPEHPYTKLLEELDGACYVRFDKPRKLVLAWKGRTRVEVYNMEGACVDFFRVPGDGPVEVVQDAIEEYMATDQT